MGKLLNSVTRERLLKTVTAGNKHDFRRLGSKTEVRSVTKWNGRGE